MKCYNVDSILHIGEAGLEYLDEYDDVRFINFEHCSENAMRHFGTPEAQACIARSQIQIGRDGQITRQLEFFTQPITIFTTDNEHRLQRLRMAIEQTGWKVR
jgi:hypothetical protein